MHSHKGQSTVEYILLVTAIIAVVIAFTNPTRGLFSQRVNQVFTTTTQDMLNVASYLQDNAAGTTPTTTATTPCIPDTIMGPLSPGEHYC